MTLEQLNKEIKRAIFIMNKSKTSENESYWEGYLNALKYVKQKLYPEQTQFNQSLPDTDTPKNS